MQSHEVTDDHFGLIVDDYMMHDKICLYLFVVFELIMRIVLVVYLVYPLQYWMVIDSLM